MHQKIKVGVVGSAGYTGGELIRLLINHPFAEIVFLHSNSNAQQKVHAVHKDLLGDTDFVFTDQLSQNVDVVFLCLGHGESKKLLENILLDANIRIIDLSQDFRINPSFENREFIYGLPEMNFKKIQQAKNIANPGCFATAIQLSLLPIIEQGAIKKINIVGITGSTGAGQGLQNTSHFSWRTNNISAYKTLTHQHLQEIKHNFCAVHKNNKDLQINFVPWRGDFAKGIFVSSIIETTLGKEDVQKLYHDYYNMAAYTFVVKDTLDLKLVINTNKCLLQLEHENGVVVVHAILDNLLKGASGQALQNMNIMFQLPEQTGLQLKSIAF